MITKGIRNVHHDKCDLEPINEELENSVAKLLSENKQLWNEINHVKQVFKDQFDSINQKRVRHKEQIYMPQCDKLVLRGVKCSTSNYGSKPLGNKKNDRISQKPSRNKKNKVEAQPRKVNKMNRVVKPICDVDVKQSLSNANSNILCATCNKSMFDGVHDKCILDLVQNGNNRAKSAKKHKKQNIWKPTGHVFTKVVQILLWYLDSGCSKHMTGNRSQLMNFVYYVEGLGHNLFSVGQFCDADLEAAFRKNTCFICNLDGVDLLSGSRDTNLYTISLDDMLKSSLICLLSKASKTKSWLWHRRLSHLNFGTLNKLVKDDLA
ncbi:retrovirus-related pol polyprotein from transposon TNT 1-94 [Tanacetum coccineum]